MERAKAWTCDPRRVPTGKSGKGGRPFMAFARTGSRRFSSLISAVVGVMTPLGCVIDPDVIPRGRGRRVATRRRGTCRPAWRHSREVRSARIGWPRRARKIIRIRCPGSREAHHPRLCHGASVHGLRQPGDLVAVKYRLNSSAGRAALTKPVRSPAPGPDSLLQRETGRLMPLRPTSDLPGDFRTS